jgi:uncharacterized protein with GYD domain
MPLYMSQFSLTSEAWAALAQNPEDRTVAVRNLADSLGARLISYYYSFGEYDGLIIIEAPDESIAAAMVVAAVSAGHIRASKTTTLLSVEDGMEVMRKAGVASFRRPGVLGN